jgi:uncharacterized protein YjbI with pentapeptide repeats
MVQKPIQIQSENEMYRLIREDRVEEFNARKSRGELPAFRDCDFRGQDLRQMDVAGIDFSGCYFRQADLRGLDLTTCTLEGASIHNARISGVYFPRELAPEEIVMSMTQGTRMRYR